MRNHVPLFVPREQRMVAKISVDGRRFKMNLPAQFPRVAPRCVGQLPLRSNFSRTVLADLDRERRLARARRGPCPCSPGGRFCARQPDARPCEPCPTRLWHGADPGRFSHNSEARMLTHLRLSRHDLSPPLRPTTHALRVSAPLLLVALRKVPA